MLDYTALGNPSSTVDDDWIEQMGMSDERAIFECHHVRMKTNDPLVGEEPHHVRDTQLFPL